MCDGPARGEKPGAGPSRELTRMRWQDNAGTERARERESLAGRSVRSVVMASSERPEIAEERLAALAADAPLFDMLLQQFYDPRVEWPSFVLANSRDASIRWRYSAVCPNATDRHRVTISRVGPLYSFGPWAPTTPYGTRVVVRCRKCERDPVAEATLADYVERAVMRASRPVGPWIEQPPGSPFEAAVVMQNDDTRARWLLWVDRVGTVAWGEPEYAPQERSA